MSSKFCTAVKFAIHHPMQQHIFLCGFDQNNRHWIEQADKGEAVHVIKVVVGNKADLVTRIMVDPSVAEVGQYRTRLYFLHDFVQSVKT